MTSKFTKKIFPFGIEFALEHAALSRWASEFRHLLDKSPLVLARTGITLSKTELIQFSQMVANRSDPFIHWDFGTVMELRVDPDTKNYLFSREKVPLHWDGAFHTEPHYLLFHCVEAGPLQKGGETLFSNTEMILEDASQTNKDLWKEILLTYKTEKKAHYGGSFQTKLLRNHPHNNRQILRFAEPVETNLNPVTIDFSGPSVLECKKAFEELVSKAYEEKYCYKHNWRVGDLLIVDNHTLVHGREKITDTQSRRILRTQLK